MSIGSVVFILHELGAPALAAYCQLIKKQSKPPEQTIPSRSVIVCLLLLAIGLIYLPTVTGLKPDTDVAV